MYTYMSIQQVPITCYQLKRFVRLEDDESRDVVPFRFNSTFYNNE